MRDNNRIVSDSIVFSLASALAVVSASALNLSIVVRFGAGYQADAFFLAYTVPGVLAGAVAIAMRLALVPSFVRLIERNCPNEAWRIISAIGTLGLVLWLVVALAGIVSGPLYIKTLAPSLSPDAYQLAVQINQWVFTVVPLTWLAEFLRALLNAQQRFILPVAGESFANILVVTLILVLGKRVGIMIVGVSFVARMLVQVAVLAPGFKLVTKNMQLKTIMGYKEVKSALGGFTVRLGGALLRQSSNTVERFWSTSLQVGTISALSYAQLATNMLSKIFSNSVATILLPALSQVTWRQQEKNQDATTDALRFSLFLTAPVAAFSVVFSHPICQIVFSFSDTAPTVVTLMARLLAIYALRTPTLALISVLLAPFYALEDVWTPVKHMLLMLIINLGLDVLLFPTMSAYGFPIAAVLTDILSIARAFWLQDRISIRYPLRSLGRDLTIILMSTGVVALLAWTIHYGEVHIIQTGMIGQLIILGLTTILGGGAYLLMTGAAGIPEAKLVTAMALRRVIFWRPRC